MVATSEGSSTNSGYPDPGTIPTSCPYCGSPLKATPHKNGTIEMRCVKTQETPEFHAHGMTLYVKPRRRR